MRHMRKQKFLIRRERQDRDSLFGNHLRLSVSMSPQDLGASKVGCVTDGNIVTEEQEPWWEI